MKRLFLYLLMCICLFNSEVYAEKIDNQETFIEIKEISLFLDQNDYIDFIRSSLFQQPEFSYATSLSAEQEFNLKYAQRGRFPSISGNIINDESIERNITDNQSVRKRRDDSFDATIEIRQPIFTSGQIGASIREAKNRARRVSTQKESTISTLVLDANRIYLDFVSSSFIYSYAENLLNNLRPYKEKVDARVNSGIMDPIDSALFSVRYSRIQTLISQLKSISERDNKTFSFFYQKDLKTLAFPKFYVDKKVIRRNKKSYDVNTAELTYKEKKEQITSVRSEYLPQMGISAKYTKYDIDDDSNEDDIRGGLYLSVPIFNFGRGIAKINSAKAAAEGSRNAIDIAEKEDNIQESSLLSDFNNSIANRPIFLNSLKTTIEQRKTIQDRLELSGFAINAYAEVVLNEISQMKILIENESTLLQSYLSILHQNQQLNNTFRIEIK
jgi:hypothetical protein